MAGGFVALGLVQGALAAFNALGLVLLWRTTRVVNLAQPAVGLVGGVLTGMLVVGSGWSFWWAAPVGVVTGAVLGFASERLVMTRLATAPRVVPLVATIGLAALFLALQSGIPFVLGGRLPSYDVDVGVEWFVFPVLLKGPHLLALGLLPVCLAALWWFAHRSRVGIAAVAVGQDIERAQTLGVNAGFVRGVSWAIAGAMSGVAGVLSIPVLGFSLGDGVAPTVLLLALGPAVLAGLRSLPATALASLAVGVAYQYALVHAPTAAAADVALGCLVAGGLLARRRLLQREAVAERASSWAAGTDSVALPASVRHDRRWKRVAFATAGLAVVVAALPPLWLSPSGDVRYGTGAALALAAVAAATAWVFVGEIALGHWGIAGLAVAAASMVPGPLLVRGLAGVLAGSGAGLVLAAIGLRRGGLAAAVSGLAVAVAAPYWLTRAGTDPVRVDSEIAAAVGGAVVVAVAVCVTWLRGRHFGLQMVAARDDRRRATGFGVDVRRARVAGMALSGALAGLAGVVYLANVPAGVAPGAFDAARSLDVLAFAMVGGLGSPIGAAMGAGLLILGDVVLPSPWATVVSGAGVVWVVLVAPAGLSRLLTAIRDRSAGVVCGNHRFTAGTPDARRPLATMLADEKQAIVAGSDTRAAMNTPTVRAAITAAFCVAAPAICALFGAPAAAADHLGMDMGRLAPWFVLVSGIAAVAAAVAGWRGRRHLDGTPMDVIATAGVGLALIAFAATSDELMAAVLIIAGPIAAAWVLGRLARTAAGAVRPRVRSAAAGVVVAGGVSGMVGAGHLALVASGSGLLDAAGWAAVYLVAGAVATGATARRASEHSAVDAGRVDAARAPVRRRHWAPVRVESLTVDLGTGRILDGVSLEVRSGEVVALVGANGAGKSTLLRAIAGFVDPAGGRVDVAGEDTTGLRPDERAAIGVAFVSGARPVFADLTVRENLRVGAYLTHRTDRSFVAALEHVLALVPTMSDKLDTRAALLSGGEQRQLAIAQTLFRRPAVLLADELALGLDREAQAAVLGLLRVLADEGMGVVVVDHDLAAVTSIADRVIVIHDGTAMAVDDPDALDGLRGQLLAARFLVGART